MGVRAKRSRVVRYRYKTWYWGNWIQWTGRHWQDESGMEFPASQVRLEEMEEYDEAEHGLHNEVQS